MEHAVQQVRAAAQDNLRALIRALSDALNLSLEELAETILYAVRVPVRTQRETIRRLIVDGGASATLAELHSVLSTLNTFRMRIVEANGPDSDLVRTIEASLNGTATTDEVVRDALPTRIVDRQMLGEDGRAECPICQESVERGMDVTALPCAHWFHADCIEPWLQTHNTCPVCRQIVFRVH